MAEKKYVYKIGRRKTATATLRLFEDTGASIVNEKPLDEYFPKGNYVHQIFEVFRASDLKSENFYFTVKVQGGGMNAQAGAIRHALARAMAEAHPDAKTPIKQAGLLTRDPRMVERKKAGFRKARRSEQYSKR